VPSDVQASGAVAIAAGRAHSLALLRTGQVAGWGNSKFLQTVVPGAVRDDSIVAIAAKGIYSMALSSSGRVYVWGGESTENSVTDLASSDVTAMDVGGDNGGFSHFLAIVSGD
jgi:alpha-tubulin suppressor-like RCC1 family protein